VTPALEITGLQKAFGATAVLRGVDLSVNAGECLALVGPNGAGKSTLFDTLSGRVRATAGQIRLQGVSIDAMAPRKLRRLGLSRSFQVSQLFATLGAREHLFCALAGAERGGWRAAADWLRPFESRSGARARVDAMLQLLGLADRADQPVARLSYADQRALELGLAFSGDPSVVLLDEPTAGMSRDETRVCTERIRRLSVGRTVVVVEHDMQVVFELADRIAVLDRGVVLAIGAPAGIRADARVRAAYGIDPEC
jgi:branched-chain amino acid transport system ATP-binding protein